MRRLFSLLMITYATTFTAPLAAEPGVGTGLLVGVAASPDYEVGTASLNAGLEWGGDIATVRLELGIPIPPSFSIQTPLSLILHPFGSSTTRPFAVARARPVYFAFVGCHACRGDFLEQGERPPTVWGLTGDAGLGYQFGIGDHAKLFFDIAYTAGYYIARENDKGVEDDLYHGGIFNLGFAVSF